MDGLREFLQTFWYQLQHNQLPNLGAWNYLVLALLVAVEGPIATLIGAAAASAGLMRPALVFIAAATGNLTADSLWYSLGYAGKIEWLLHYGRWFGVKQHHLDRLKREMYAHATKILFIAKLSAGFIIPSLIAAGLARVPWRRWFPIVFTAEMIWTGSLVAIGYFATEAIKKVEKGVEYLGMAGSILLLLLVIWLLRRAIRKRQTVIKINGDNDQKGE